MEEVFSIEILDYWADTKKSSKADDVFRPLAKPSF